MCRYLHLTFIQPISMPSSSLHSNYKEVFMPHHGKEDIDNTKSLYSSSWSWKIFLKIDIFSIGIHDKVLLLIDDSSSRLRHAVDQTMTKMFVSIHGNKYSTSEKKGSEIWYSRVTRSAVLCSEVEVPWTVIYCNHSTVKEIRFTAQGIPNYTLQWKDYCTLQGNYFRCTVNSELHSLVLFQNFTLQC